MINNCTLFNICDNKIFLYSSSTLINSRQVPPAAPPISAVKADDTADQSLQFEDIPGPIFMEQTRTHQLSSTCAVRKVLPRKAKEKK